MTRRTTGEVGLSERFKKTLINTAKVIVTLALLTFIALTVDLKQVWQTVKYAHWIYLLLAWLLFQLGILIRSYRWQELLRANGIEVKYGKLVGLYYVGTFFNNFLPTGFGGDVVKMFELARGGAESELAVASVLADRLLGLVVLALMALTALPFGFKLVPLPFTLVLLAIIAGLFLVIIMLINRRAYSFFCHIKFLDRIFTLPKVRAFFNSFQSYSLASLKYALLASLGFNITLIGTYILLGVAVSVIINPLFYFIFIPILSTLLILPISVSGLGVREGGYVVLFAQAGVASAEALAMSLLFYGLNVLTGLIGGILYLIQSIRMINHKRGNR
ncbi:MAG: lysylphosphatidylglycerol synthase transmembrane domain-containing protein [Anaerolineae bacterium]